MTSRSDSACVELVSAGVWEVDMAEPTTVDPRAGTVPAPVVKLRSLEFKSDHQLLKGCKEETGWKNEGAP